MSRAALLGRELRTVGRRVEGFQLLFEPVRLAAPVPGLARFLPRGAAPFALVEPGGHAADQKAKGESAKQEQEERRLKREVGFLAPERIEDQDGGRAVDHGERN